ncbi:MAG TPA: DUF6441 family protein [Burkholderiales bacterium]|nr:DUF6441 family protein [Burkholderiales bacterium]
MISMRIELDGLFKPDKLRSWERLVKTDVRESVSRGMGTGAREVVERLRYALASSVKVKKSSFPKTISHKVFDKKLNELPALMIGTRASLVAAHAFGAKIPGPVLIPLLEEGRRIGRKRFAALVRELMNQGNAGFRNVNGKVILFAEQDAANAKGLAPFRRAERLRRGGKFRKQRGRALEIPIAVLVRDVVIPQRFSFTPIVQAGLPNITNAIQRELDKV